jgi:cation transport regulator ChaC
MADGWEMSHGCLRRSHASLRGFSRAFDKASTESRGTPEHPAPTLRVVPSEGVCHGIAFQFSDERRAQVLNDLSRREGKGFPLRENRVLLEDGESVIALVPIYVGLNIIKGKTLGEIATMALSAKGQRGSGAQYVEHVARHLQNAGIDDPVVANLLREIRRLMPRGVH